MFSRTPDHHRSSNFLIGLRHSASRRSQHSTAEANKNSSSKKWHKRSGSFGALLMGRNGKNDDEDEGDNTNNHEGNDNRESDCCDCHSDHGSSW